MSSYFLSSGFGNRVSLVFKSFPAIPPDELFAAFDNKPCIPINGNSNRRCRVNRALALSAVWAVFRWFASKIRVKSVRFCHKCCLAVRHTARHAASSCFVMSR